MKIILKTKTTTTTKIIKEITYKIPKQLKTKFYYKNKRENY